MGKLLLSSVLLIMIVTVSYLQAVRRQAKVDNSFQLGVKSNQKDDLEQRSFTDSLETGMGEQEVVQDGNPLQHDKLFNKDSDSLTNIINMQNPPISELMKKEEDIEVTDTVGKAGTERSHLELLAYYKERYDSLPKDLSENKRNKAISEIRQETANKFSITIVELNRIRHLYKLNY